MPPVTINIIPHLNRHSNGDRAAMELANAAVTFSLSRGLTAAGTARGTTATKAKTVNTFNYTIMGAFYTKAATDDFWTFAGTTVAAAAFQKYLLLIDTAGAASIQEAKQSIVSAALVDWTNITGLSRYAPVLQVLGSTKCCVGTVTIATDATHTFVPGTTALNGTGITATFADGMDQSIIPLVGNATGVLIGNGA